MLPVVFKILTPKVVKGIISYVFDKNPLDEQMEMVLNRIQKLEDIAHPKKEFVRCKQCEERITEAGKLMQSIGDETI